MIIKSGWRHDSLFIKIIFTLTILLAFNSTPKALASNIAIYSDLHKGLIDGMKIAEDDRHCVNDSSFGPGLNPGENILAKFDGTAQITGVGLFMGELEYGEVASGFVDVHIGEEQWKRITKFEDVGAVNGNEQIIFSSQVETDAIRITMTRGGGPDNNICVREVEIYGTFQPSTHPKDRQELEPITVYRFRVRGHMDKPNTPLPLMPPSTYFFISEDGFPSIGMSMDLFRQASRVKVSIIKDGDLEDSKIYANNRTSDKPLIPHTAYQDRIVHINLFDVIEETFMSGSNENLFEIDESYHIRVELMTRTENIFKTIVSPVINVYDQLTWVNQRLDYLARKLFKFPFDRVQNWDDDKLEDRMWRLFSQSRHYSVSFIVANYSTNLVNDKTLYLYALIQAQNQAKPTLKKLTHFPVNLGVMDEKIEEYNFSTPQLKVTEINDFQGLTLTLGEQNTNSLNEVNVMAQKIFTLAGHAIKRIASKAVAGIQERETHDYSLAASKFRREDYTYEGHDLGKLGEADLKAAQEVVSHLHQEFEEFKNLKELREKLFKNSDIARLHTLMTDDFEGVNLHFGKWIPRENGDMPSVYSPDYICPGWDVREIIFKVSPHVLTMRTLGTIITMGLSQGDLPVSDKMAISELKWLQAKVKPSEVNQWFSHNRIPDGFFTMSEDERNAFFENVSEFKPFYHVRGDLVEGFMSRQIGRNLAYAIKLRYQNGEEFVPTLDEWRRSPQSRSKANTVRYLPGWHIFHRWKRESDGRQMHQQGTDGLVSSIVGDNPRTNILVLHNILEAKSGMKALKGQLKNHRKRIKTHGIQFVDPPQELIDYIKKHLGIEPTIEPIAGRQATVVNVPKHRIHIHEQSNPDLFKLVTTQDIAHQFTGVENLKVRENQRVVNDFAEYMQRFSREYAESQMRKEGFKPRRWDDRTMDLSDYKRYYADIPIRMQDRLSVQELTRRFLAGERIDPQGNWRNVYTRESTLFDPFMGEEEYMDKLKQYRPDMTKHQVQTAREFFRKGRRWNPFAGRYTAEKYRLDPQGRMSLAEHRELIRRNQQANVAVEQRLMEELRVSPDITREQLIEDMYKNGERYNITTRQFVKVEQPETMEPNSDISNADRRMITKRRRLFREPSRWCRLVDRIGRSLDRLDRNSVGGETFDETVHRRAGFRNAAGDALSDILQAMAAGSQEYARLKEKRLKVKVAKTKQYNTAYMIVLEGRRKPGTNEYEWVLAGSPDRQAYLLKLYFQNSGSAWVQRTIPKWFEDAIH